MASVLVAISVVPAAYGATTNASTATATASATATVSATVTTGTGSAIEQPPELVGTPGHFVGKFDPNTAKPAAAAEADVSDVPAPRSAVYTSPSQTPGGAAAPSVIGAGSGTFAAPSFRWLHLSTMPAARTGASFVYDATRQKTVLFGGNLFGTRNAETWTFDGATWTHPSPATSPPARSNAASAWCPTCGSGGRVVVFGGSTNSGSTLADTWMWNGTTWTQVTGAGPVSRDMAAMAYVPSIGKLVLFGGTHRSATGVVLSYQNDTWTFNGTTWTLLNPSVKPSARFDMSLSGTKLTNSIVLFGGATSSGTNLSDTWTFNGTNWAQQTPTSSPSARQGYAFAYDPTLHAPVLYGGYEAATTSYPTDLWLWDGATWLQGAAFVNAGTATQAALAPTPTNGQLVKFSGGTSDTVWQDTRLLDYGGLGLRRGYTTDTHHLSDRATANINITDGNAVVHQTDVHLPGAGLDLSIGRSYNTRLGGAFTLGSRWTFNIGTDVYSSALPDGSVVIFGLYSGDAGYFQQVTGSTTDFISPPGWSATLKREADNTLTLTMNPSEEVYRFSSGGQLMTHADRNQTPTNPAIAIRFFYNADGTLDYLTDTEGRSIDFTYSPPGTLTQISVPDGRTWQFAYTNGDLTTFTDANGKQTTYQYDGLHELTRLTTPAGRITAFDHDFESQVFSVRRFVDTVNMTGPRTMYWRNPRNAGDTGTRIIGNAMLIDPNEHRTNTEFDAGDRPATVTDDVGHIRSVDYTGTDNLPSTLTNAMSAVSTLTYDTNNNLAQIQAPASAPGQTAAQQTWQYNTTGATGSTYLPSSTTDPQDHCTALKYNTDGNVQDMYAGQGAGCDGQTGGTHINAKYQGDSGVSCGGKRGELCSVADALGTTNYSYNTAGDLTTVTPPAPLGATTLVRDANNSRVNKITDGKNQTTKYCYDPLDRIIKIFFNIGGTDPDCTTGTANIGYVYDDDGNITSRVDNTGTTTWAYDALARVTKKIPAGAPTNTCSSPNDGGLVYRYDEASNLISACDGAGTTNYGYDGRDNPVTANSPITLVGVDTFSSDNATTTNTLTLPSGLGANDQIIVSTTVAANHVVTTPTGYTLVGTYTSGTGAAQTKMVVLRRTAAATDKTVTLTYDGTYFRSGAVSVYRGVSTSTPINVSSSASSQTATLTVPSVTTTAAGTRLVLSLGATGHTTPKSWNLPAGMIHDTQATLNTTTATSQYGEYRSAAGATGSRTVTFQAARPQVGSLLALNPATPATPIVMTYDNADRRTTIAYPNTVTQTTEYNDNATIKRIHAEAAGTPLTDLYYAYSYLGSTVDRSVRTSMLDNLVGTLTLYGYDTNNRLTLATSGGGNDYSYTYDVNGNRTQQTTPGGTTNYAYNAANELCWSATAAGTGCATPPAGATTYAFDADGNLTGSSAGTSLTYNTRNQTAQLGTTTQTYADAGQNERTASGTTSFVNGGGLGIASQNVGGTSSYFVRDPHGTLLYMKNGAATNYYLSDALGSIVGTTDVAGTRTATYSYDPYGTTTASGTNAANNPWRYAAGYQDTTPYNYYKFGARYYDTTLGRWTQQDAIPGSVANPKTLDRYGYAGNNPISNIDPSGDGFFDDLVSTVGAAVGGFVGAGLGFIVGGPYGAVIGGCIGGSLGYAGATYSNGDGATLQGSALSCVGGAIVGAPPVG